MKKILTALLLLTFCTVQTTWAGSIVNVPQQLKSETVQMDYKSKDTGITKSIAISNYYYVNIENNAVAIEVYDILKQNKAFTRSDITDLLRALDKIEGKDSIIRALKTDGLMPKYVGARYFVLNQPEHLNSITDTYCILKDYGISEKDMKNIMEIYTSKHKKPPISVNLVKDIISDNSVPKEDKVYYIYAKLYALTEENPQIEEDMINAYKIMKQYPDIFKKESENTDLNDDVYWVLRYNREECKTTETVQTVIDDNSIQKDEKMWRILGKLKVYALKDEAKKEKKNYPPILYEMAEEGKPIITYFWENNARKYYEDEKVLQDAYSAYKLLKKAGIEDLDGDSGRSVLTIHPELCKAEAVTKEVLNDTKIAKKDKAKIIGRRIIREYYKARDTKYSEDSYSSYRTSDIAYKAIEKGIIPEFTTSNMESYESDIERMVKVVQSYDLMKTNSAFKDKYIEELLKYDGYNDFSLYDALKKVINDKSIKDKDKPNMVFREFLLYTSKQHEDNKHLAGFFDAGILSLDNNLYKDRFYYKREDDVATSIIKAAKLMKKSPNYSEEDFLYIIDEESNNKYMDIGISQVINDSSIRDEDKAIFALANIRKQEYIHEADMPEEYYKAVEMNIVPFYIDENRSLKERNEDYYTKLFENYHIMRDELQWTGDVIQENLKPYEKENEIIYKVLTNDKISNEKKLEKIKKDLKSYDDSENAKWHAQHALKKAEQVTLIIITSPIWLPLAIIFSPILISMLNGLRNHH